MNLRRRKVALGAAAALLIRSSLAQSGSSRIIRIVVPFAAGGPGDFVARLVAISLAKVLGQTVVVENKPGASGNLGARSVLDAAADGHTLLLNTVGMQAVNPLMYPNASFDPKRDFLAVGIGAVVPNVLVVHPTRLGVRTLGDLVRIGKEKLNHLSFATFGPGSSPHIYGSVLEKVAGFSAIAVPYKGSAPASADVMAGQVDFLFDSMTTCVGLIQGGKLNGLAITSAARSPLLPDVPTLKEAGYPGLNLKYWLALQVSAKTPPDIVANLRQAMAEALADPGYIQSLTARGAESLRINPAQLQDFVNQDAERWSTIARTMDIKAE